MARKKFLQEKRHRAAGHFRPREQVAACKPDVFRQRPYSASQDGRAAADETQRQRLLRGYAHRRGEWQVQKCAALYAQAQTSCASRCFHEYAPVAARHAKIVAYAIR